MSIKKAIFSSFLFLFLSLAVQAQMEDSRLGWKANALTWEDFKAPPDPNSHFFANTSSGISYSWSMKGTARGKEYEYEVLSIF